MSQDTTQSTSSATEATNTATTEQSPVSGHPGGSTEQPRGDGDAVAEALKAAFPDADPPKTDDPEQVKRAPARISADPVKALEELRQLAISGEFDQLIQNLGVNPGALKVPDGRFRRLKQITREQKSAREELAAREHQFAQHAQQLQTYYAPIHEAAQAIQDEDYDAALKALTGGKLDAMQFTELLARQLSSADPNTRRELVKLRREQEAQRREREQAAEQQRVFAEQQQAFAIEQSRRDTEAQVSQFIAESGDQDLAGLAQHPRFLGTMRERIETAIHRGWEPNPSTMREEVVELARRTLLDLRKSTAILHGQSANTAATGQNRGTSANPPSGESRPTEVLRARPAPASQGSEGAIDEILRGLFG